jgi:hypothetical protein
MPPRYQYVKTRADVMQEGVFSGDPISCEIGLTWHNSLDSFIHRLGYECGGVYALDGADYIVLAFSGMDVETSTLYRLNAITGERTELLTGEFESLETASPDGRYALLIEDNSGLVERSREGNLFAFALSDFGELRARIYDTRTGRIVHDFGRITDEDSRYLNGAKSSVSKYNIYSAWLDTSTLYIDNKMIEIKPDAVEITELPMLASVLQIPDQNRKNWLLYDTTHNPAGSYYAFHVPTRTLSAVIEGGEHYEISTDESRWVGDELLEVEVRGKSSESSILYTIRVPQPAPAS